MKVHPLDLAPISGVVAVYTGGPGRRWFRAPSYQHEIPVYRSMGEELLRDLGTQVGAGVAPTRRRQAWAVCRWRC